MAKSHTTTGRKTQVIATFPAPNGNDVPAEFQEPGETQVEEAPPEPAPAPSRNPLKKKPAGPMAAEGDFFKRVQAIPRADWGTRVYLYLYVLEPLCNLRQSGGKTYLNRYSEPVKDEHQIMMEYGSGRYRLMLAASKVSPEDSSEMARHEFECYNPQFPPKVPRAAWVNDSRNVKWEALLPKEAPPTNGAGGSLIEAIRTYRDIREDLKDELQEEAPEPAPVQTPNDVLQTMKLAKELFAQPAPAAPAPAKDPLEIAVALFQTMNQMKAENPVIDMYRDELKANREELRLLHEKLAAREKAEQPKGLLEQLTEFAAMGDKLEPLKKLFGGGGGAVAEATGRAARPSFWDFAMNFADTSAGAALVNGLTNLAAVAMQPRPNPSPGMMQTAAPIVLTAQAPNGTAPQEDPQARMIRIGQTITAPMLYEYFFKDAGGDEWADNMWRNWPEDYAFMRSYGPAQIVALYQSVPQAWAIIGPKEAAFREFITEFCEWDPDNPNENEGEAPGTKDSGVVDLTEQEPN